MKQLLYSFITFCSLSSLLLAQASLGGINSRGSEGSAQGADAVSESDQEQVAAKTHFLVYDAASSQVEKRRAIVMEVYGAELSGEELKLRTSIKAASDIDPVSGKRQKITITSEQFALREKGKAYVALPVAVDGELPLEVAVSDFAEGHRSTAKLSFLVDPTVNSYQLELAGFTPVSIDLGESNQVVIPDISGTGIQSTPNLALVGQQGPQRQVSMIVHAVYLDQTGLSFRVSWENNSGQKILWDKAPAASLFQLKDGEGRLYNCSEISDAITNSILPESYQSQEGWESGASSSGVLTFSEIIPEALLYGTLTFPGYPGVELVYDSAKNSYQVTPSS